MVSPLRSKLGYIATVCFAGALCTAAPALGGEEVTDCCEFSEGVCGITLDPDLCQAFNLNLIPDAVCLVDGEPCVPLPGGPDPIPDGGACGDPADCASGNCVDDVCCDTTCEGATERCNLPGSAGTCTEATAAPAASPRGLVAMLAVLLGIVAVARRRSRPTDLARVRSK